MKYIKIFENFQSIIDDIFSISYLITDLGLEFSLRYHREGMSHGWVDCRKGDKDIDGKNQYSIRIMCRSQKNKDIQIFKDIQSNSEFIEFHR